MEISTAGMTLTVAMTGIGLGAGTGLLALLAARRARQAPDARERVVRPGDTAVMCEGPATRDEAGVALARGPLGTRHQVTIVSDEHEGTIGKGETVVLLEEDGARRRAVAIRR